MGWAAIDSDLKKKKFPDEDDDDEDYDDRSDVSGSGRRNPPDGGYGWVVLLAAFSCNVIVDGIGFSFIPAREEYMEIFNASFSEVSWVGSSLTGSYLIVGPIVGAMCVRWGLRTVTILGSIISMLGFVLSSFAKSLEMLIFTYGIIGGIGLGMMYLPSIVCVSYWFDKKLGIATGIAVCGSGLGQFLFPPFVVYLMDEYQWQGKHLILGAIVLHGAVCGALFRPPDRWHHRRNKPCHQMVEMERGIIMKALIEEKKRQRTISDGSLDNCVITTQNRLIKLEPSLLNSKQSQTLRNMLRGLGYSIQSLSMSKTSLPSSVHRFRVESVQQTKLDQDNSSAANSKTNSPQFLLPGGQLQKRNSSPDFNKVSSDQPPQQCNGGVVRSNSVVSNQSLEGLSVNRLVPNGVCSNGTNSPVKGFPKTKSCDALSQQPYNMLIKKIMHERVRSNSECVTTHSSTNLPPNQNFPLGSSPALPVGSVDISIQEIAGSEAEASCYNSSTSVATDTYSQYTNEYIPNSSQNTFVTTGMLSAHQLEASLRRLRRREWREGSIIWRAWEWVLDMFKLIVCPIFVLFLVSSLFTLLAFYIPYYNIPTYGLNIGMAKLDAEFLLSILGITSTIGRLIVGWLQDRPWINTLYLNNGALLFSGVCCIILPSFKSPELLCVITAVLGFCLAVFVALRSVLLVKFLGVEMITKSFGLFCLFQGLAAFAGIPLAGLLAEHTGSLDITFYAAGLFTIVAGVILFPLGILKKKADRLEASRLAQEETDADGYAIGEAAAMSSPAH